eukprot:m.155386 g.155386  ORF g.155386 m.155386 type:complete len:92 (-) comp24655_c0_seq28:68-343(-)
MTKLIDHISLWHRSPSKCIYHSYNHAYPLSLAEKILVNFKTRKNNSKYSKKTQKNQNSPPLSFSLPFPFPPATPPQTTKQRKKHAINTIVP